MFGFDIPAWTFALFVIFKILAQQLRIPFLYLIKISRAKYCLSKRLFTFISKQLELESKLTAGA